MSKTLYLNMFAASPVTRAERRRAKRRLIAERLTKALIYAGSIMGFAISVDNPVQYISVAGSICIALECFR